MPVRNLFFVGGGRGEEVQKTFRKQLLGSVLLNDFWTPCPHPPSYEFCTWTLFSSKIINNYFLLF